MELRFAISKCYIVDRHVAAKSGARQSTHGRAAKRNIPTQVLGEKLAARVGRCKSRVTLCQGVQGSGASNVLQTETCVITAETEKWGKVIRTANIKVG